MAAMNDYDGSVRRHAANVLGDIGDSRAIPVLINALKNRRGWRKEREDIVFALGKIGGSEAVQGLIYALRDDFCTVSSYAALCLGRIGGDEAYRGLIEALPELCGQAREYADRALVEIGDLVRKRLDGDSQRVWYGYELVSDDENPRVISQRRRIDTVCRVKSLSEGFFAGVIHRSCERVYDVRRRPCAARPYEWTLLFTQVAACPHR